MEVLLGQLSSVAAFDAPFSFSIRCEYRGAADGNELS